MITIIPVVLYFLVRTCRDVKAEVKEDRDHSGMLWRDDLHHDHEHEHGHDTPNEHNSDGAKLLHTTNRPLDKTNPSAVQRRAAATQSRPHNHAKNQLYRLLVTCLLHKCKFSTHGLVLVAI